MARILGGMVVLLVVEVVPQPLDPGRLVHRLGWLELVWSCSSLPPPWVPIHRWTTTKLVIQPSGLKNKRGPGLSALALSFSSVANYSTETTFSRRFPRTPSYLRTRSSEQGMSA